MTYEQRVAAARQEIQQVLNRHQVYIAVFPEDYGGFASLWIGADQNQDVKITDNEWKPE